MQINQGSTWKGVWSNSILEYVGVDCYIAPFFHILFGIGNTFYSQLFKLIDKHTGLKNLPPMLSQRENFLSKQH